MIIINRFVIQDHLDGLNEYTKANRSNKYYGANMKRLNEEKVSYAIQQALAKGELSIVNQYPIELNITWFDDTKRDADNITFGIKFIQDALVKTGILVDDSRKYISGFTHKVIEDKDDPHIEVIIDESD